MRYKLLNLASYLPDFVINLGIKVDHKMGWYDPADGWGFWLDTSYWKYCRKDCAPNMEK